MEISRQTLETLIDLLEIKLSCVEIYDGEDTREFKNLQTSLTELMNLFADS